MCSLGTCTPQPSSVQIKGYTYNTCLWSRGCSSSNLGNLGRKDIVSPFPLKYLKMGVLFGQSPPYIPDFGAPALSQLLRSKERARTLQAELPPTSSSFCPHFTNSFCEQMKRIRPKKKDRPAEEKRHSSAGRKICVCTQGNFCAHENLFPSARKFCSLRKEAYPPTQ